MEKLSKGYTVEEIISQLSLILPINFSLATERISTSESAKKSLQDVWWDLSDGEWDCFVRSFVVPQVKWSLTWITDQCLSDTYWKVKQDSNEWLMSRQPTVAFGFYDEANKLQIVAWKMSRASASICENIAGWNNWMPSSAVIKKLLFPDDLTGNENLIWGKTHEDDARQLYQNTLIPLLYPNEVVEIFVGGLFIDKNNPWIGVSDDGVAKSKTTESVWLIEIKCPGAGKLAKLYPQIPSQYECQIQLIMHIRKLPFADFIVWNPWNCYVQRRFYDQDFATKMINDMENFWFGDYLKASLNLEIGVSNWVK